MMERQFKDSGIEWIGRIPEGWKVDIAKHIFKQRREKGNEVECQLLAATQKYGMYPQNLLEGVVKVAADTDLSQFKTVHKNDYVISLRSFQGGFEMSDYEGVCSPAYQVFFATRPINSKYYKYLFKSDAFIQEINSLTIGIREGKNISYDDFVLLPIPIPSVLEQQRIASYLDKKCGEIDELIALQEKMITQLTEYKQAVITEAVTKGLDPNTKLVPSGIEWIGDVPEGWQIIQTRRIVKSHLQGYYDSDGYVESGYRLLRITDLLGDGYMTLKNAPFVKESPSIKDFILKRGDFCFARTGGAGNFGFVSTDIEPAVFASYLIRFRFEGQNNNYLRYYFLSFGFINEVTSLIHGGVNKNIHAENIKDTHLTIPTLYEQQQISAYLDAKCSEIDSLIALKRQKMEVLNEYKKSVIYEAVTGKIDI